MNAKIINTRKILDETDLLNEALDAFRRETNLAVKTELQEVREGITKDAAIRIEAPYFNAHYFVEVRRALTEAQIGLIMNRFAGMKGKWLVVTRYVPPPLAKKMKALNCKFIDTAGNAYIKDPPLFLEITGHKPMMPVQTERPEKLWNRAGVKVIFALLCKQDLVNATYREIANAADVALGTIPGVWNDLIRRAYILELGPRGRRLQRTKELFEKWVAAYNQNLRPKNLIERYAPGAVEPWNDTTLHLRGALWGGEPAAAKLTRYLKPEIVTIYTARSINDLILRMKLRKDEDGIVQIRQKFWNFTTEEQEKDIAPPVLVYADLMATADTRNIETAKILYDEYIKGRLRED